MWCGYLCAPKRKKGEDARGRENGEGWCSWECRGRVRDRGVGRDGSDCGVGRVGEGGCVGGREGEGEEWEQCEPTLTFGWLE